MSQPISVQDTTPRCLFLNKVDSFPKNVDFIRQASTKLGKIASQGWKKFFPN